MTLTEKCEHCGSKTPHEGKCPSVKAIEYFPNGKVKRVEYMTAADYCLPVAHGTTYIGWPVYPQPIYIQPTYPPAYPWYTTCGSNITCGNLTLRNVDENTCGITTGVTTTPCTAGTAALGCISTLSITCGEGSIASASSPDIQNWSITN